MEKFCNDNEIALIWIGDDPKCTEFNGAYGAVSEGITNYKYYIKLFIPKKDHYTDKDNRAFVNMFLHELKKLSIKLGE